MAIQSSKKQALKVGPSFFNFTGMWLAVAKKQMA
jgi:hypothetical protein